MNKSLVIIEDEPGIRDSLKELFQLEGFEVHSANNGKDGLQLLKSMGTNPCAILLDLFMPEMNGLEFLNSFRSEPKAPFAHSPIILMTAGSRNFEIFEAARKLSNHYLKKPLDIDMLIDVVNQSCL